LDREFHAEGGGEKRVSDITYLRTTSGRVYLTVAPALYDRNVIGRALGGDMESRYTVVLAIEMAVGNRAPPAGGPAALHTRVDS
jgi:transposase InsO family protein